MKLLSKLSAKEILGDVNTVVKNMKVGDTVDAYAVAGICAAYETGISTFGEWVRFIGEFEGVNYLTGEICRAPKAHVPDVLEAVLMDGIKGTAEIVVEKCTKHGKHYRLESAIEFSYAVCITRLEDKKEDGAINYKYTVDPKTEIGVNDRLSHLTKLIAPQPAPKVSKIDTKKKQKV